jgi:hypothetical protein
VGERRLGQRIGYWQEKREDIDGKGDLLEVGVEAILVTVLLLDVKLAHGHLDDNSSVSS